MPVYPGDPEVRISPALTADGDGANVLSLAIGSHSGTHVDAPFHVRNSLAALDALPPAQFSGPVELIDVRSAGAGGAITAEHLSGLAPATAGDDRPGQPESILLLRTGFAEHWSSPAYLDHPWLDASAAQLIVDRGYRAVGVDALSVDRTGSLAEDQPFPAHHILAGNGCVIAENLTGLDQVQRALASGTGVEVFLFPLSIPDADGAPVRAMARTGPASFGHEAPSRQPGAPSRQPESRDLSRAEVQEAADGLIAAFAATDTERYFAAFSPSATFIFHPEPEALGSRSEYRQLWDMWVGSGWKVLDCRSSEQNIQLLGSAAVFTHRVATVVRTGPDGSTLSTDERETIVFTRTGGGEVVAVHEHLSAVPGPSADPALPG
jgi:kynurenine formamidase/ketosteroid isomerase-like protein